MANSIGCLDQQPVASFVSEAVVDDLETIEVEEQHGILVSRRDLAEQ